jgi:hypothetical protein
VVGRLGYDRVCNKGQHKGGSDPSFRALGWIWGLCAIDQEFWSAGGSNKEIDGNLEELRESLGLRFTDGAPAAQDFRRDTLVAEDRPDVFVLQSPLFHEGV